jgi:hypothetical protein
MNGPFSHGRSHIFCAVFFLSGLFVCVRVYPHDQVAFNIIINTNSHLVSIQVTSASGARDS